MDDIKVVINLVNSYKNAISGYFNTVCFELDTQGNKNPGFCYDTISRFKKIIDNELADNIKLVTISELNMFNTIIENLLIDVVRFFMSINNHDGINNEIEEHIILNYTCIKEDLKVLNQFDLKIKKKSINADSSIANNMRGYCLNTIQESIYFLSNSMFIDIEKCPFKIDFNNLQNNLDNKIIEEEINIKQEEENSINIKSQDFIIESQNSDRQLSLKQIALIYAYENQSVTIENQDEIALKHGHTSGKKLHQFFTFYYSRINRKGKPFPSYTRITVQNKIKLFESIIDLVDKKNKGKVVEELKIIKGFLSDFE